MLYGSETWPTKIEDIRKMQWSEMRMLRWMAGVSLSESKSNECVRSMLAIDDIAKVINHVAQFERDLLIERTQSYKNQITRQEARQTKCFIKLRYVTKQAEVVWPC